MAVSNDALHRVAGHSASIMGDAMVVFGGSHDTGSGWVFRWVGKKFQFSAVGISGGIPLVFELTCTHAPTHFHTCTCTHTHTRTVYVLWAYIAWIDRQWLFTIISQPPALYQGDVIVRKCNHFKFKKQMNSTELLCVCECFNQDQLNYVRGSFRERGIWFCRCNEVWLFDFVESVWKTPVITGKKPNPRYGQSQVDELVILCLRPPVCPSVLIELCLCLSSFRVKLAET